MTTDRLIRSLGLGALLPTCACGGGGITPPPPPPPAVASVTVASAMVALTGTVPRTATVKDASGNDVSPTSSVSWTSDNPAVAQVSSTGMVTGVAAGVTTIRALSGGQSGSATITVADLVFTALSAGAQHDCGLASGILYCWGDYSFAALGSLPDPEQCIQAACSSTPRQGVPSPAFSQVSAGGNHTCGLAGDGTAFCWGDNYLGQLGAPSSETCVGRPCSHAPVAVTTVVRFVVLSAGAAHTCGLTAVGVAYCWGYDQFGQLGANPTEGCDGYPCSTTPVSVSGGLLFSSISAGGNHTCGVTPDGVAYCWGRNNVGQLGHPGQGFNPVAVGGGLSFGTLSSGSSHSCAVTVARAAFCWGENLFGQLGDGTTQARAAPTAVAGGLSFLSVRAGFEHSCGVTTGNAIYCWGNNTGGILGDGTTSPSSIAVLVQRGLSFSQVEAGATHTCGRTTAGRLYCWGRNHLGQLGNGAVGSPSAHVPVGVAGLP